MWDASGLAFYVLQLNRISSRSLGRERVREDFLKPLQRSVSFLNIIVFVFLSLLMQVIASSAGVLNALFQAYRSCFATGMKSIAGREVSQRRHGV